MVEGRKRMRMWISDVLSPSVGVNNQKLLGAADMEFWRSWRESSVQATYRISCDGLWGQTVRTATLALK